ncbi:MAG: SAM-dependent methyltransferase, partial [Mycobacterium sp.]|nr:SAM-dependent methyltransferase [Mycobacterium sp.]
VRAVGVEFFTRLASGELDPAEVDDSGEFGMERMRDMMAVRTRFFDDFFVEAVDRGLRQAVILASGLDARAYRLPWPAATTVYEIDQPQVIEFKTRAMAQLGASPTAHHRTVAIDLRHDWPTALKQAGFDATQPAAWSAEGLLPFLPPAAQDRLLDNITGLSSRGSRLATENLPDAARSVPTMADRMREVTDRWRDHGFDVEMTDLWYPGDRNDVVDYLNGHGWDATAVYAAELFASHGFSVQTGDEDAETTFGSLGYVTATRI